MVSNILCVFVLLALRVEVAMCYLPTNSRFFKIQSSTVIVPTTYTTYTNRKPLNNANSDISTSSALIPLVSVKSLIDKGVGADFARIYCDEPIAKAVDNMNIKKKGSVLVYNREDKVVGIFTERDFLKNLSKNDPTNLIQDVMTPSSNLIVGKPEWTIRRCQEIMAASNVRHLPIEDDSTTTIGVLSQSDIIRFLAREKIIFSTPRLFGESLEEVSEQSRDVANFLALEQGEVGKRQDTLRTGFVVTAALFLAAILQADWVHNHEYVAMIATFLLGYVGIVFETYFEFNKAAIALIMSTALWVIFAGTAGATGIAVESSLGLLSEKVSEVAEVVFFLMGAMTIVEIVDAHQGFKVVTDVIKSKNKRQLMLVISLITFFMSAVLDNLTTTIVMVSLIRKLLPDDEDRKLFGAMIVIAANAGGAWTPIGDVTTTMLWINGQISAIPTMTGLFLPSIASTVISALVLQKQIPEDAIVPEPAAGPTQLAPRGSLVFAVGLGGLLSVPIFKAVTGLPPYLGMLAALGLMWSLTDAIHAGEDREELTAPAALKKIDTSGVLFFLGILLSVGALDSSGILRNLAEFLDSNLPNESVIATIIGLASALIDNVPLVAATMGMYKITDVPTDSSLWQLIAFCAGTGGSLLIIGSAAGVALMGIEKVDFVWYAKRISFGALLGYLGGIGVYLAQQQFVQGNLFAALPDTATTFLSLFQ